MNITNREKLVIGIKKPLRMLHLSEDTATLEFIEYMKSQPLVRAVLTGHLHFNFKTQIIPALPRIITGGGFDELATVIEIS